MSIKTAYQEKLHHQMDEWKAEIDLIKAKIGKMSANAKVKANVELRALKEKQKIAHDKLKALKNVSDDVWEQAKAGLDLAWTEVKLGLDSLKKRFGSN